MTRNTLSRHHSTYRTTGKDRRSMMPRLTSTILALGIASTALAGTAPALAASHNTAPAGQTTRSQADLTSTVSQFGYALIHGPDARINSFATAALLSRAPSGHLINLLGPAGYPPQNPPASFTFQVTSNTPSAAAATMVLKWGALGMIERTQWVYTGAGWKLSTLQYGGSTATRQALMDANYAFLHDYQQGGRNLNRYASANFLRHAPGGQLVNFYGFQNPFRSASVSVNWFSIGMARVTQRFYFGGKNTQVRIVTWSYESSGWKIIGVAGPGRG